MKHKTLFINNMKQADNILQAATQVREIFEDKADLKLLAVGEDKRPVGRWRHQVVTEQQFSDDRTKYLGWIPRTAGLLVIDVDTKEKKTSFNGAKVRDYITDQLTQVGVPYVVIESATKGNYHIYVPYSRELSRGGNISNVFMELSPHASKDFRASVEGLDPIPIDLIYRKGYVVLYSTDVHTLHTLKAVSEAPSITPKLLATILGFRIQVDRGLFPAVPSWYKVPRGANIAGVKSSNNEPRTLPPEERQEILEAFTQLYVAEGLKETGTVKNMPRGYFAVDPGNNRIWGPCPSPFCGSSEDQVFQGVSGAKYTGSDRFYVNLERGTCSCNKRCYVEKGKGGSSVSQIKFREVMDQVRKAWTFHGIQIPELYRLKASQGGSKNTPEGFKGAIQVDNHVRYAQQIIDTLDLRLRFNEDRKKIEYLDQEGNVWSDYSDYRQRKDRMKISETFYYVVGKKQHKKWLELSPDRWRDFLSATLKKVRPFKDYLIQLYTRVPPEVVMSARPLDWVHQELWSYDAENKEDERIAKWCLVYPFLGAALRTLNYPRATFIKQIPVIIAGQDSGKSTYLRAALPEYLRDSYFSDQLNLHSTEGQKIEAILGRAVVEIADISGSTKQQKGQIKSFLSRESDSNFRLAYRADTQRLIRVGVFVATADDPLGALDHDPAGQSRWVPYHYKGIQDNVIKRFPVAPIEHWYDEPQTIENITLTRRDWLWAHAVHFICRYKERHKKDFNLMLPKELHARRDLVARRHIYQQGTGSEIDRFLAQGGVIDGLTAAEILCCMYNKDVEVHNKVPKNMDIKREKKLPVDFAREVRGAGWRSIATSLQLRGFKRVRITLKGGNRPWVWKRDEHDPHTIETERLKKEYDDTHWFPPPEEEDLEDVPF